MVRSPRAELGAGPKKEEREHGSLEGARDLNRAHWRDAERPPNLTEQLDLVVRGRRFPPAGAARE